MSRNNSARTDLSIAIIGGGIGGLATAISLLQAGFDVHVYEQARWLSETGAGINIGPNASRLLIRLGLGAELAATGVRPQAFHQRRWQDGRTLARSPLGDAIAAEFGAPNYSFHRGDLHSILAKTVPAERVHLAHRCVGVAERGDRVEVRFENGVEIAADLLTGADGIHSTIRHALLGPEHPRFTGCIAYRGMVPAERLPDLPVETTLWLGPGRHFIHYFVSAGRLLNFVGLVEQDAWIAESWTERGEVADVMAAYEGWHPQVRNVIGSADEVYKWALLDRTPLPHWSVGRVTLLGDACHPMLPFMGQGGAQAIEDAAVLTGCLVEQGDDVPSALKRYETLRLPRTARVQGMSQENKMRFHLPDGPQQQKRDAMMAKGSTDWSWSAIAWLYGHDAGLLEPGVEQTMQNQH